MLPPAESLLMQRINYTFSRKSPVCVVFRFSGATDAPLDKLKQNLIKM